MIRRHLHNRIYLIPGILHMMTALCFMIHSIRHFHISPIIAFPLLSLMLSILILPNAVLSIVIGFFYCSTRKMHQLKKIQMIFAIISASVNGLCLMGLAVLVFMGEYDVETMILLVLFELVLAVMSSIFLSCFSPKKKDEEEEAKYQPNRKNSFIITRPTVNEIPNMDQFHNEKNVSYMNTYAGENYNQRSPSIQELPKSENSIHRDAFSSKSFQGKPSSPQIERIVNARKFLRPGAVRVQNLRQVSVNIDDYPTPQSYPQYTQTEPSIVQDEYTDQGIINLGGSYENLNGYSGQHYPNIQEYQSNEDLYNMRCAHLIDDSYSENGHSDQSYLHREGSMSTQEYYAQEVAIDTEDSASASGSASGSALGSASASASASASNSDQQSDLYQSNNEEE